MAFFKNLFEKKTCDICGGEIGLLGNRKLADGNMCKDCAKKLSPWFEDRREATIAQINEQLHLRDVNFSDLQTFSATKNIGREYHMLVEEENGIPQRFLVTRRKDYMEENPDVILMDQVEECIVDIDEQREEVKHKDSDGNYVSYEPRRYEYKYDFYINFVLNHPYLEAMRFKINDRRVEILDVGDYHRSSRGVGQFLLGENRFDASADPEWREYKLMCNEIEDMFIAHQKRKNAPVMPAAVEAYEAPQPAPAPVQQPAAAAGPKFCPECGAPTGGAKFCGYCGTKLI